MPWWDFVKTSSKFVWKTSTYIDISYTKMILWPSRTSWWWSLTSTADDADARHVDVFIASLLNPRDTWKMIFAFQRGGLKLAWPLIALLWPHFIKWIECYGQHKPHKLDYYQPGWVSWTNLMAFVGTKDLDFYFPYRNIGPNINFILK